MKVNETKNKLKNFSIEGENFAGQYPNLQEILGSSFRGKRKSSQVVRKKLIADKKQPEHLSTKEFFSDSWSLGRKSKIGRKGQMNKR